MKTYNKKAMDSAVDVLVGDEYCGRKIGKLDLMEVADRFGLDWDTLGMKVLEQGIEEGWLFDEYFA